MHAFLEFLENLAFSQWVKNAPTIWAFPTILVLHTGQIKQRRRCAPRRRR